MPAIQARPSAQLDKKNGRSTYLIFLRESTVLIRVDGNEINRST